MLDIDALIGLAVRAGKIALRHFRNVIAERKPDRSFVTRADREVESFIRDEAARMAPDVGVLGEEMPPRPGTGEYTLVVDPIDGTGSFLDELPTWSISIGLCRNGEPVRGVVHVPVLDETYAADGGELRWKGVLVEPRSRMPFDSESRILVSSRTHWRYEIRFEGKIRSLGSTAYHLALVARGMGVGALLGRPRAWDLAAGVALVRAAGGDVLDLSGKRLNFAPLMSGKSPEMTLVAHAAGYGRDVLEMFRKVER
jgi:myo-inositol-1(or 4)-monophosphatase